MTKLFQHPVVFVLLCVSLIGTPVIYRGGASSPHPHMFLEFMREARAGTFDHHHHTGDATDPDHHEHEHDPAHEPEQSSPRITSAGNLFGPVLSAFIIGDVGQLALILPQSALPETAQLERAFLVDDRIETGVIRPPTSPPPR